MSLQERPGGLAELKGGHLKLWTFRFKEMPLSLVASEWASGNGREVGDLNQRKTTEERLGAQITLLYVHRTFA